MANISSILNDIKKVCGVDADYDVFNTDIMMHINSVFSTLNQLGVGPAVGFSISGESDEWPSWVTSDKGLNVIQSYIYLRVRLLFDPPPNAFVLASQEEQIKQMEWRINVHMEKTIWTDPEL